MQVSVEKLDDFARRVKVSVPGERFQEGIHARIRELSKSVQLKGFRQGKVPPLVIEKRYGQQIRDEVTQNLIRDTLTEAFQQHNLRPAHSPNVTRDNAAAGEFAYVATFDVMPEFPAIEVADLEALRAIYQEIVQIETGHPDPPNFSVDFLPHYENTPPDCDGVLFICD